MRVMVSTKENFGTMFGRIVPLWADLGTGQGTTFITEMYVVFKTHDMLEGSSA